MYPHTFTYPSPGALRSRPSGGDARMPECERCEAARAAAEDIKGFVSRLSAAQDTHNFHIPHQAGGAGY